MPFWETPNYNDSKKEQDKKKENKAETKDDNQKKTETKESLTDQQIVEKLDWLNVKFKDKWLIMPITKDNSIFCVDWIDSNKIRILTRNLEKQSSEYYGYNMIENVENESKREEKTISWESDNSWWFKFYLESWNPTVKEELSKEKISEILNWVDDKLKELEKSIDQKKEVINMMEQIKTRSKDLKLNSLDMKLNKDRDTQIVFDGQNFNIISIDPENWYVKKTLRIGEISDWEWTDKKNENCILFQLDSEKWGTWIRESELRDWWYWYDKEFEGKWQIVPLRSEWYAPDNRNLPSTLETVITTTEEMFKIIKPIYDKLSQLKIDQELDNELNK